MKIEKACTGAALDGVEVQSETMTALPFLTSVLAFPTETQRVKAVMLCSTECKQLCEWMYSCTGVNVCCEHDAVT